MMTALEKRPTMLRNIPKAVYLKNTLNSCSEMIPSSGIFSPTKLVKFVLFILAEMFKQTWRRVRFENVRQN